jgi:opacity protein-like surface antigen
MGKREYDPRLIESAAAQSRELVLNNGAFRFGRDKDDTSFIGGAQVGVNGQWGWLVAGLELDFNWLGNDRKGFGETSTGDFHFDGEFFPDAGTLGRHGLYDAKPAHPAGTFYNGSVRLSDDDNDDWLSTVRGRLGFTPWERLLIYGTAGVAFQGSGDITAETTLTRTDCPGCVPKEEAGDDSGGLRANDGYLRNHRLARSEPGRLGGGCWRRVGVPR